MIRIVLFLVLFAKESHFLYGQQLHLQALKLPINLASKDTAFEFSCMAWWGDKLLLVPTLKSTTTADLHQLYSITNAELKRTISDSEYVPGYEIVRMDSHLMEMLFGQSGYDGIEATAVVGNNIYFAVETKNENKDAYVFKGSFDTTNRTNPSIKYVTHNEMRKPVSGHSDAGFESLVYLQNENKLMAVFEWSTGSGDNRKTQAYQWDTLLIHAEEKHLPGLKASRLSDLYLKKNRLSDLTVSGDELVGINSIFLNPSNAYSELIKFKTNSLHFNRIGQLCFNNCGKNWEGIVPFEEGWLLISDNNPAEIKTSSFVYVTVRN